MPQLVRNSLMAVVLVLFVHLSRFGLEEPSECCHKCLAQEQAGEGHTWGHKVVEDVGYNLSIKGKAERSSSKEVETEGSEQKL